MSYGSIRFYSESKKSGLGQVFLGWVRKLWPILPCLALSERWKLTVPWQKIEADKQDHLHPKKKKRAKMLNGSRNSNGHIKNEKIKGGKHFPKKYFTAGPSFCLFYFWIVLVDWSSSQSAVPIISSGICRVGGFFFFFPIIYLI